MDLVIWKIRLALQALFAGEKGEDLVEYAILAALLSLGVVAGMDSVGGAVAAIFNRLGAILYNAIR